MATFRFVQRSRKTNSNEPIAYDVTDANGKTEGSLTKLKNNWHLSWCGTQSKFASRHELCKHLRLLGHTPVGL
jgi:hypothetical protein